MLSVSTEDTKHKKLSWGSLDSRLIFFLLIRFLFPFHQFPQPLNKCTGSKLSIVKFIQLIKPPSQSVWILSWGKAVWYIKQKWTSVFPKVATTPCGLYWRRFHASLLLVLSRHRLMLCTILIWFTHYSPKALISNLWLLLWSRTANEDMLNYLALQLLFKAVFLERRKHTGIFLQFLQWISVSVLYASSWWIYTSQFILGIDPSLHFCSWLAKRSLSS